LRCAPSLGTLERSADTVPTLTRRNPSALRNAKAPSVFLSFGEKLTGAPLYFPSRALLAPHSDAHNSRGEGECRERPRETLLVAAPERAPVIALILRGLRARFFMASVAGARRTFGPAAELLPQDNRRNFAITLAFAREPNFFATGGNRFPIGAFSACGTGLSPRTPSPRGPSLEPRRNCPGLFDSPPGPEGQPTLVCALPFLIRFPLVAAHRVQRFGIRLRKGPK
jgi:hypothetical protein